MGKSIGVSGFVLRARYNSLGDSGTIAIGRRCRVLLITAYLMLAISFGIMVLLRVGTYRW